MAQPPTNNITLPKPLLCSLPLAEVETIKRARIGRVKVLILALDSLNLKVCSPRGLLVFWKWFWERFLPPFYAASAAAGAGLYWAIIKLRRCAWRFSDVNPEMGAIHNRRSSPVTTISKATTEWQEWSCHFPIISHNLTELCRSKNVIKGRSTSRRKKDAEEATLDRIFITIFASYVLYTYSQVRGRLDVGWPHFWMRKRNPHMCEAGDAVQRKAPENAAFYSQAQTVTQLIVSF